jgi:hypothetical protein
MRATGDTPVALFLFSALFPDGNELACSCLQLSFLPASYLQKDDWLRMKNEGQKIILGDLRRPDEKTTVNRHMRSYCRMCRT